MNDELFKKVEKKTKVKKGDIISLAQMVNDNGLKDEKTLRHVISELSSMTGKKVDKNLETKHKGLFVIGDCSGVTHSLSHASASGVYVARHITENL